MSVPLAFISIANLLALSFTLSVLLLAILWRNWRTRTGRALFQFLVCLVVLQSGVLLTHLSLAADFSEIIIAICINITILGFFLLILASQALLLQAARAMTDVWIVVYRSGLVALFVLQPAIWKHRIFDLPGHLGDNLFGSPYTPLGRVLVVFSLIYLVFNVLIAWAYWRRINAPLLMLPILLVTLTQIASLLLDGVRELTLSGIVGGFVSGFVGFYLILRFDLTPQSPMLLWLRTMNTAAVDTTGQQTLQTTLSQIADQTRRLMRIDTINVLLLIGPDRLEVTVVSGRETAAQGRQIRVGEGLSGRVVQTLQPMRVDNYQDWQGRAVDFADLSYFASLSVPLVYAGKPIGVINAHEITPERVYTEQDQAILEMIAPLMVINIIKDRHAHEQDKLRTYIDALMAQQDTAIMIFNTTGHMTKTNALAQQYVHTLFGETLSCPSAIAIAGCADNDAVIQALVQWTTHPGTNHTVTASFKTLGAHAVQLQSVPDPHHKTSSLLFIMRKLPDKTSAQH